MGAGAAISHNFVLASSGAGIIPFALYAVATPPLISTLSEVGFSPKKPSGAEQFYPLRGPEGIELKISERGVLDDRRQAV